MISMRLAIVCGAIVLTFCALFISQAVAQSSIHEAQAKHIAFNQSYVRLARATGKKCIATLDGGDECLVRIRNASESKWTDLQDKADVAIRAFESIEGMVKNPNAAPPPSTADAVRYQYLNLLMTSGRYCKYLEASPPLLSAYVYVRPPNGPSGTEKFRSQNAFRANRMRLFHGIDGFIFSIKKCKEPSEADSWRLATTQVADLIYTARAASIQFNTKLFDKNPGSQAASRIFSDAMTNQRASSFEKTDWNPPVLSGEIGTSSQTLPDQEYLKNERDFEGGESLLRSWLNLISSRCPMKSDNDVADCLWPKFLSFDPAPSPSEKHPWAVFLRSCRALELYPSQETAFPDTLDAFKTQYALLQHQVRSR